MNKKEKLKALQELMKGRDMSAWEGVEKYRKEHNGELPPEHEVNSNGSCNRGCH